MLQLLQRHLRLAEMGAFLIEMEAAAAEQVLAHLLSRLQGSAGVLEDTALGRRLVLLHGGGGVIASPVLFRHPLRGPDPRWHGVQNK